MVLAKRLPVALIVLLLMCCRVHAGPGLRMLPSLLTLVTVSSFMSFIYSRKYSLLSTASFSFSDMSLRSASSDGSEQLNGGRLSWCDIIWNSDEVVLCFAKKM